MKKSANETVQETLRWLAGGVIDKEQALDALETLASRASDTASKEIQVYITRIKAGRI